MISSTQDELPLRIMDGNHVSRLYRTAIVSNRAVFRALRGGRAPWAPRFGGAHMLITVLEMFRAQLHLKRPSCNKSGKMWSKAEYKDEFIL